MDAFRYAQFCPLARAAEILGHRWTLLVIRELMLGPQRFSDLLARLPGLSRSVLAARLAELEARGVVERRTLPPPAPATVYALTEAGHGLAPALAELTRWGLRFLELPRAGDHAEPDWVRLAVDVFARRDATPRRRLELVAEGAGRRATIRVEGGPGGTRRVADDAPVEAHVRASVPVVLGLMSGRLSLRDALDGGLAEVEGDREALAALPALFDVTPGSTPADEPQGVLP